MFCYYSFSFVIKNKNINIIKGKVRKQGDNINKVIYVKELENIEELFCKENKIPYLLKILIVYIKKTFCILTLKEDGECILPYSSVKNIYIIRIIKKCILKLSKIVVLSEKLKTNIKFNEELNKSNIYVLDGKLLFNYLILDCLEYISKNMNTAIQKQEISILLNKYNELDAKNIIHLAKSVKRVNIVTPNINSFKKLENYLQEELGISVTVTNNKRKSLLKSKIIINMDFDEEMLSFYNINSSAIIINTKGKINVKSKSFVGINICDYDIIYKSQENEYKSFDRNIIYESFICSFNNYDAVINKIREDEVKIVNLIGQNGVIDRKEYLRVNV